MPPNLFREEYYSKTENRLSHLLCYGCHREIVIPRIASTAPQKGTDYSSKRFSTYPGGLRDLQDWGVCVESTGKYWFPVHNILASTCHVVVGHPKFVKAIKGKGGQEGGAVDCRSVQALPCAEQLKGPTDASSVSPFFSSACADVCYTALSSASRPVTTVS